MDQRLCIVTVGVADLAHAKRFYLDGLGWTEVEQPSDGICFIQMPGMVFAMYPAAELADDIGVPAPELPADAEVPLQCGVTLAYNTASKAETDTVLATAVSAGARLVKDAEEVFWGGYSGYFADPDGHLWEVAYNPYTVPGVDGSFVM